MHENQSSIFFQSERQPEVEWMQLHHVIVDRGSRYSATLCRVESLEDVKRMMNRIRKEKRYKTATHNSYAYRMTESTRILDGKQDDGETGAGMAILRVLHRNNMVNVLVVITRWFGGIKLHGDRFKHIVDATQEILDRSEKEKQP